MAKKPAPSALLLLTGVLALGSGCSIQITDGYVFDYSGETSEKTESGTIVSTVKTIEIKNKFGDVDVAQSTGESNWTWNGRCWATDKSDAEEFVSQLEMNIAQRGDKQTWTIVLPARSRKLRGLKSNLIVRVPSEVSVVIANEHGKVSVRGISGSTRIDNQHGGIEASSLTGQTTIKNEHGKIAADDVSGDASIECEHGDIKIVGSSATLSVKCEHGEVDITNSSSDVTMVTEHGKATIETSAANVKCDSQHCDVTIKLNNEDFQSIIAKTEHSDVVVLLPPRARPRLDLTVDHGKVKSDFQSSEDSDSPHIRINTEHGDIAIREM